MRRAFYEDKTMRAMPYDVETADHGDRLLTCRDCRDPFTLAAGEAAFFRMKGLAEPKRCPACRQAKRARNAQQERRGAA